MASAIMHICIANELNKKLKRNKKDILLGSIAPDLGKEVNSGRQKSHFIESDDNIDIEKFVKKYPKFYENDFDLGYFIHLYSDIIWNEKILKDKVSIDKLEIQLINGEKFQLSEDKIKKILYNDYSNVNITLIDHFNLDLELFYNDLIIPITTIKEIPIQKIRVLIDKMGVIIANSKEAKNYIIEKSQIIDYIEESVDTIMKILRTYEMGGI